MVPALVPKDGRYVTRTGRLLRDISTADADGWRAWLVLHEELSPAAADRRVIAARTMWRKAIRWKLAGDRQSPAVAAKHYAMCTDLDADFKRSIGAVQEKGQGMGQQKGQKSGKGSGRQNATEGAEVQKTAGKQGI